VAAQPRVRIFAPTPLDDPSFTAALSAGAQRALTLTQPGFLPTQLTAAGRKFDADFRAAFGRAPALGAIFGYEAMAVVLDSLRRAGTSAGSRSEVVRQFFRTSGRSSVIGTYSIDAAGDIQGVGPYVVSRVAHGAPVPFEQRQG
jgi:branched-chain amino acid transport system substrate-binding protein